MRLLPFLKPTKGVQIAGGGFPDSGGGGGSYTLPPATDSTLGGVKIGSGVNVTSDGTISVTGGGSYVLPIASDSTLGGIKVGDRLSIDSTTGVLTASDQSTPVATTSVAGKVKPDGTSITVDANGVISASGGGLSNWTSGNITLTATTSGASDLSASYVLSDTLLIITLNNVSLTGEQFINYTYPSTLPVSVAEPQGILFTYNGHMGRAVPTTNTNEIDMYISGSGTITGIFGQIIIPINPS